jgi:hypothetical protein
MLDYARERATDVLRDTRAVVLVTSGPAGVLAGEFPCKSLGLNLYLLVPRTSDHLFNLEREPSVTLVTTRWELKGEAHIPSPEESALAAKLLREPGAECCVLVRVDPCQVRVRREGGWGDLETIDLKSS